MEGLDYWRLCDELSIVEAALLFVGCDPAGETAYVEAWSVEKRPAGYQAVKTAIAHGLRSGAIQGHPVPMYDYDLNGNPGGAIEGSVDFSNSRVEVESFRRWLKNRGIRSGFFFPLATDAPDYLDPANARYAPKLAAAVRAWEAVTDSGGKHPKQALAKWLREHAAEFAMTDEEGKPNETGIEETAKVANWQPGGGAPKTPSE